VGICKRASGAGGGGDTLHGHYGWFESCDTPLGRDSFGIFATATRGYIINLHIGEERAAVAAARRIGRLVPARYDGDWFWAALVETVDLRPKDALDALNPSESPWAGRSTTEVAFRKRAGGRSTHRGLLRVPHGVTATESTEGRPG
jgi:hypothetical protein